MIVTADDFGFSDDVNAAIVEAFELDLVNRASLMANMPAFEAACGLAREHGLLERLGVHLVLTEGMPLTEPIRSFHRFCDGQGRFRYWRKADRAFQLGRAERDAVAVELRAQILRCCARGINVTHLDSHHHIHNKRAIARIVISLARELDVPRVRLAHNCGPRIGRVNRLYKWWFVNRPLRRAGLAGPQLFGHVEDYLRLQAAGVPSGALESFEVNIHPVYRQGMLADRDHPERPLAEVLAGVGAEDA